MQLTMLEDDLVLATFVQMEAITLVAVASVSHSFYALCNAAVAVHPAALGPWFAKAPGEAGLLSLHFAECAARCELVLFRMKPGPYISLPGWRPAHAEVLDQLGPSPAFPVAASLVSCSSSFHSMPTAGKILVHLDGESYHVGTVAADVSMVGSPHWTTRQEEAHANGARVEGNEWLAAAGPARLVRTIDPLRAPPNDEDESNDGEEELPLWTQEELDHPLARTNVARRRKEPDCRGWHFVGLRPRSGPKTTQEQAAANSAAVRKHILRFKTS